MIENNKLIAEFMGYKPNTDGENVYAKTFYIDVNGKRFCQPDSMKYHNSWDWLMPVVKRISEEIPCGEVEELHDFYDLFHYGLYESDINKVYSAVLQFIQWFNTQKQSV